MSDPADVLDVKDFLHHNNNVWCQTVFIRQCLRPSLLSLQCCCDTSSQSDWPSHFWAASEVSIWCFNQNSQIRNAELSASVYKYVPNMCDSGKEHLSNDTCPMTCLLCSDDPDKSCPVGSAACLVNSHGSYSMGSPTSPLELVGSDRYNLYSAMSPLDGSFSYSLDLKSFFSCLVWVLTNKKLNLFSSIVFIFLLCLLPLAPLSSTWPFPPLVVFVSLIPFLLCSSSTSPSSLTLLSFYSCHFFNLLIIFLLFSSPFSLCPLSSCYFTSPSLFSPLSSFFTVSCSFGSSSFSPFHSSCPPCISFFPLSSFPHLS